MEKGEHVCDLMRVGLEIIHMVKPPESLLKEVEGRLLEIREALKNKIKS